MDTDLSNIIYLLYICQLYRSPHWTIKRFSIYNIELSLLIVNICLQSHKVVNIDRCLESYMFTFYMCCINHCNISFNCIVVLYIIIMAMPIDFELGDLNELPSITHKKKYRVFICLKLDKLSPHRNRHGYFSQNQCRYILAYAYYS